MSNSLNGSTILPKRATKKGRTSHLDDVSRSIQVNVYSSHRFKSDGSHADQIFLVPVSPALQSNLDKPIPYFPIRVDT